MVGKLARLHENGATMREFISVLEIAEEIGTTVPYVLARAVSDPAGVTLRARSGGWTYREAKRVDYGAEVIWAGVGGGCEALDEITILPPAVVAEQILLDGVLRVLPASADSSSTHEVRFELEPPRSLHPAQLLLDAESARTLRRTCGKTPPRELRIRELRSALDRGRFRLTTTEAADRVYPDSAASSTKRKRLERLVEKAPADLPAAFAVGGPKSRKLFTDDSEALALWFELATRPSPQARRALAVAQSESSPAPEHGPNAQPSEDEQPSGGLAKSTRGSLRARQAKGRDQ